MNKDCSMEKVMERLKAPFPSKDIEWRVSRSGISSNGKPWAMVLAYVTNRAIQNRLDEVFGPGGWKNDYRDFMQGILCTISCNINGEWVSKADGAEQTQFESLKGGLSAAMKRAGSQWGIGRYLYDLTEIFVDVVANKSNGAIYVNDKKTNVKGYWLPPQLPDWALPENERKGKGNYSSNKSQSQAQTQTQSTKSQQQQKPNNQSQQQRTQNNQQKRQFDRDKILGEIGVFLKNTGLEKQQGWIMPLFKKINPSIKQGSLTEVYNYATEEEIKMYYKTLFPVNGLVKLAHDYKIDVDTVLNYVQILLPTIEIKNIFSCFTHVTLDHLKEVMAMVKEELQAGGINQIA